MLLSDDDRAVIDEALAGDPEPLPLIAAYERLLERIRPLSVDGWSVNGGEILPLVHQLQARVHEADVVYRVDVAGELSDDQVLAELGDGVVFWFRERRFWRPRVMVDLSRLEEDERELERAAGVVMRADGRYQTGIFDIEDPKS